MKGWERFFAAASIAVLLLAGLPATPSRAQGTVPDAGHCRARRSGVPAGVLAPVLACWNPEAGADIPERVEHYPEPFPELHGWDFRINLPHVRFQMARPDSGSATTMVGVIEDTTPLYNPGDFSRLMEYGHQNNSIWMFRVDRSDGRMYAKVLPSRRDLSSAKTDNVRSLTDDWFRVGQESGPQFRFDKPAVAVVGEGLGRATIYVVARDANRSLWFSRHTVNDAGENRWSGEWQELHILSNRPPALSPAFDGLLAMAWLPTADPSSVAARLFDPAANAWGAVTRLNFTGDANLGPAQLLWDGVALNLFVVAPDRTLRHAIADSAAALAFDPLDMRRVSFIEIAPDRFHVMAFNGRLHVALADAEDTWYVTSRTRYGVPSRWTRPSNVGFHSTSPRIANLYENIFVVGAGADGKVRYSRKDPNAPGNDITGLSFSDRWLEPGSELDPETRGRFSDLDVLSFNSDLYLSGQKTTSGAAFPPGAYVVNLGRAAMKRLLTDKWGAILQVGGAGGRVKETGQFAAGHEIPGLGDFDGDDDDDLIKFAQTNDADVGPAPVYVALNTDGTFGENQLWHRFFSLKGEIPAVGDFNGDGRDDVVTFTQQRQRDAAGNVIGEAVVWVALSNGSSFLPSRVWHRFFSLKDEVPAVGDFNGDGKDDIVSFTQQEQHFSNGAPIGPAVVWVALSDGTRFGQSGVWHRFFSLKGEIPAVGDFNGDGRDDVVTFTQQRQRDAAGNVIGEAVVWVAPSNGSSFLPSRVWHTTFAPRGETPRVGDMNADGRDDAVAFVLAGPGETGGDVYVAYSGGAGFARAITFHDDFGGGDDRPLVGRLTGTKRADITGNDLDRHKSFMDLFAFGTNGAVRVASSMGSIPFVGGAPWERYKWFTEKGIGMTQFPEWIYAGPNHCTGAAHRFILAGAAGSGGATTTTLSVRQGSRAGHVLQEFGHSIFANCFRENDDPFGLYESIFETSVPDGGIDANAMPGCPGDHDCRDPEHYFLHLMVEYRLEGDEFRDRIRTESNPVVRERLRGQYLWLKTHWFNGVEFKRGPSLNASLTQDGVQCLPGECRI